MNAFLLIVPIFLIRFGLLKMINQDALSRAAFFAPLEDCEKVFFLFLPAFKRFYDLIFVFF